MSVSGNPFLNRANKRGLSGHGSISEKAIGKSLGARMTPASGALRGAKGDMELSTKWLGESKCTVHDTLKLDLGWLNKISTESLNIGRTPFLTVSFVTADGKPRKSGEWVMMPLPVFRTIVEDDE